MSILGFGRFLICRLLIQVDEKTFAEPALRPLRVFERGHPVNICFFKSKIYHMLIKLIKLNIMEVKFIKLYLKTKLSLLMY